MGMTSVLLLCSVHILLEFSLHSWNYAWLVVAAEAQLHIQKDGNVAGEKKKPCLPTDQSGTDIELKFLKQRLRLSLEQTP